MKILNMVIDLWLYAEGTSLGHVILFDMKNVSFGHVGRLSPMGLKKFLYYLQEGLPVRLKGFHFMNASPVIDVILNMMRPFMKKQLMDMVRSILLCMVLIKNLRSCIYAHGLSAFSFNNETMYIIYIYILSIKTFFILFMNIYYLLYYLYIYYLYYYYFFYYYFIIYFLFILFLIFYFLSFFK